MKSKLPRGQANQSSPYGVWIGNLAWTTSETCLRDFLIQRLNISADSIKRFNMPKGKSTSGRLNRGFAYVDFATASQAQAALLLSESVLQSRNLLIKAASDHTGRPAPDSKRTMNDATTSTKRVTLKPNKRIFVGNLNFNCTREILAAHFSVCGKIDLVHVAMFQDSGKCKGYAWVTFSTVDAAKIAVRGHLLPGDTTPPNKPLHQIENRTIRCEFAEDSELRRAKRAKTNIREEE